jgi:two-component system, cell cycle sensor histidine kinase and response regulator CckA
MRLRTVVLVLALATLVATGIGAYSYYHAARTYALAQVETELSDRAANLRDQLLHLIAQNRTEARVLARFEELEAALTEQTPERLAEATRILSHIAAHRRGNVCFLLDAQGITIASSNSHQPDSLVGKEKSFRPYFSQAMNGRDSYFWGVDSTTEERGAHFGHPVMAMGRERPLGVVVIKASIEHLDRIMPRDKRGATLFVHQSGVIFLSSRTEWILKTLRSMSDEQLALIEKAKQFGKGPWEWTGLEMTDGARTVIHADQRYRIHETEFEGDPEWKIVSLLNIKELSHPVFPSWTGRAEYGLFGVFFIVTGAILFLFTLAQRDIRKRQHAEQALRKSETELRQTLEATTEGIWTWDFKNSRMHFNDKWYTMLGYRPGEFPASRESWKALLHPDDKDRAIAVADAFFRATANYYANEFRMLCKDGQYRWIYSQGRVVERDKDGNGVRIIGNHQDITDRKIALEALRNSEERYRMIFTHSPLGIMHFDQNGVIVDCNEKFAEIIGAPRQEILGFTMLEKLKDNTMLEAVRDCLNGKKGLYEGDYLSVTAAKLTPLRAIYSRMASDTGEFLGAVGIFEDVTERKQARQLLQDREQMMASMLSASPFGIAWNGPDRRIRWVNDAWLRIFAMQDSGECVDRDKGTLYQSHEEFLRIGEYVKEALAGGTVAETEAKMVRNSGEKFDAHLRLSAVDPQDESKGYITVVEDVSHEKEAEAEQERLRSQLLQAQKMEAVGTLAGGIAHDFNNLLQITLGYSEFLLSEKSEDDPERPDLEKIYQASRSGAELVKRLLTFSKKVETRPVPLDINGQIMSVEELLRRTIPRMIDIRLELAEELARVNADPGQIQQIIMNLALNARDAMGDSGLITISTGNVDLNGGRHPRVPEGTPGPYVLFSVSDTGHGMDSATIEHIFEPFYTTKEVGRGTGLGLAIVYGIVQQHGGYVTCSSEPGKGTTFSIYLPALVTKSEQVAERLSEQSTSGNETVLVVDDEDSVRELGKRILTKSGFRVLTANSGLEALKVYSTEGASISLVILDLIMPEMGGKDCLKELLRVDAKAKVLIASGYLGDTSEAETLELGARGFVAKPFRFKELLTRVRNVIDEG